MDISIVIPLFNEEESLPELTEWIKKVMDDNNFEYEIVMIDDGSKDDSWKVIQNLTKINKNIKAIKFRRNYGKSAALHVGFQAVKGNIVITMDADLQDSPEEIPELYKLIFDEKYDLISGWKKKRHDPVSKRLPSKIYNFLVRIVTGIKLHDFNCGLKAYRKDVVKSIEVYGDMHRYMPVLAKSAGYKIIGEKVVKHQARKFGVSKFGFGRAKGMLDLITISFMSRFGKKPMQFFGTLGFLSFLAGFGVLLYLSIAKYVSLAYKMTDRPLFYFGLLAVIFGAQLFLTGFLAELISRSSSDRNTYQIEENLNL